MATAPTTWAIVNADGHLEVFMIGVNDAGDQGLWHIWQIPYGNAWTPWFSHGIPPGSAGLRWSPAVACPSDGRIELFVVGDDLQPGGLGSGGALYRKRQTAPNSRWPNWVPHQAGGPDLFGTPAVASVSGTGLELFALGADGALWHSRRADSGADWSEWFSHGSPAGLLLNSAPAVASSADGHLEVFIVSEEAVMWHIRQTAPNGNWSQWFSHGTPSGVLFGSDSTPALASDSNGCLQLFTVSNDGTLWQMWQTAPNGDWSGWWPHDAPSGVKFERVRPSVASGADGCLELFLVDNGENLWHRRQEAATGDWSQWSSREAPPAVGLVGSPAVAAGAEGRLELFVAGTDGALWHTWQTARNGGWSPWYSHGAPRKFVLLDALATG